MSQQPLLDYLASAFDPARALQVIAYRVRSQVLRSCGHEMKGIVHGFVVLKR